MNNTKATVVIQIFDNSAQEPGPDEVMVFRTSKPESEIVNNEGFLDIRCYSIIKTIDSFFYELLRENDYKVTYVSDSKIPEL